ncbi:MAG: biopolymer transporter ExbD [Bdellovibrionales bacterium]|nr:biopolymer transporter ExbD [Bdellovibrionales bacterium]
MAQVEESNSSGRKTNIELNLVPFIDLMSVCIIFLLITAVWTQVSMVQLGNSIYSKKTSEETIEPPPFTEIVLRVDVHSEGFNLTLGTEKSLIPKLQNGDYDKTSLVQSLKRVKEQYPEKLDGVVSVADDVSYKYLVEAMDAFLINQIPQVSITVTGVN